MSVRRHRTRKRTIRSLTLISLASCLVLLAGTNVAVADARPPVSSVPGKAVALTIDDGPNPTYTPKILQLLAKLRIKATFCLIGNSVRKYPQLVKQIAAGGHALCNHTMNHDLGLRNKSRSQIHTDITGASTKITQASGGTKPIFFRAPGGNWNAKLREESRKVALTPLHWNVDSRDWSRPGVGHIVSVIGNAKPGSVILCHDGGGDRSQTYAALQQALPRLKSRGLAFVIPPAPR